MDEVIIRPMTDDDAPVAERLSDEEFLALDRRTHVRDWPEPEPRSEAHRTDWIARTRHFLATDPDGCWVAEGPDGVVGFATSIRREGTWCLATYAVRSAAQGRGIGKRVLDAALTHSLGCLRGMLSSSVDPKAVRRYLLAGFTMHPQMFLRGTVDRSALPVVEKVRDGSLGDVDLMDSVDRQTRGSGHGPDHAHLVERCRLVVSDTSTGSGYAYATPGGRPMLLAATNRRTATRLLWTLLADGPEETSVTHITAANAWAVDVGLAARLDLHQLGYLALRGMDPPTPYLHHGAML